MQCYSGLMPHNATLINVHPHLYIPNPLNLLNYPIHFFPGVLTLKGTRLRYLAILKYWKI